MALSMFLRSNAISSVMSQQLRNLTMQKVLAPSLLMPSQITTSCVGLKEAKNMPIIIPMHSFRTSTVALSGEKGHDHAKLWILEKASTAALLPLIPLGLIWPNKVIDSLLAILITAHTFWGLEAIAVDYVRASVVGPILPKVAIVLVYLLSIVTLGGLFYLISHDVGIANTFKLLWGVKSEQKA